MSQSTINKIESYGIIIKNISEDLKNGTLINNYRWKIYEDFLYNNSDKYKIVFTADVRDTFFQMDVFQFYEKYKSFFGIAIEDGNLTRGVNKNWLINIYGLEKYKTIEKERIICSGTVWGTVDKFYEFSKMMWEPFKTNKSLRAYIYDQGVANYLIYYDKLFNDSLIKSDNIDGRVMTIGFTKSKEIKIDSRNNVLNDKGEIAAVIHQYDRKPDIVEIVRKKYCYSNNTKYLEKQSNQYNLNKYVIKIIINLIFLSIFRTVIGFRPFSLSFLIFIIFIFIFLIIIIISFIGWKKKRMKKKSVDLRNILY